MQPEIEIPCRCRWCRQLPHEAPPADGEDGLCDWCRTAIDHEARVRASAYNIYRKVLT